MFFPDIQHQHQVEHCKRAIPIHSDIASTSGRVMFSDRLSSLTPNAGMRGAHGVDGEHVARLVSYCMFGCLAESIVAAHPQAGSAAGMRGAHGVDGEHVARPTS